LISSKSQLNLISSSKNLKDVFKRTISRLHELTSKKYN
jgi:cell division protein ZapE